MAAAGALVAATGCQAPRQPVGPTVRMVVLDDYDAFLDQTLTALRERHFTPERIDRAAGHIRTARATGMQWFEFWRCDAQGPYQQLESNLQTIGREVTVSLTPAARLSSTTQPAVPATQPTSATTQPVGDAFRLVVRVDKSRFHTPPRQVTSSSGALTLYSRGMPTVSGERDRRRTADEWIPLGRDELLEQYLIEQLTQSPAVTSATYADPALSDDG